ncbi:MAG TPA: hypothetical protein VFQ68_13175 [Streptosporangiaceae bacterium]|nr:hypothetical protein [Streptosporangiaceae bacterium]
MAAVLGAVSAAGAEHGGQAEHCGQANHGGRNAGSNARRFGRCKRCGGSGRKPRLGARLLDQRR